MGTAPGKVRGSGSIACPHRGKILATSSASRQRVGYGRPAASRSGLGDRISEFGPQCNSNASLLRLAIGFKTISEAAKLGGDGRSILEVRPKFR